MDRQFFDEKKLKNGIEGRKSGSNRQNLSFWLQKKDGFFLLSCKVDDQILNGGKIRQILTSEEKNLSKNDMIVLDYVSHRLGEIQSQYRITNDIDLLFYNISQSSYKIYYEEEPVSFSEDYYKLDLDFNFDQNDNLSLELKSKGEFAIGQNKAFFIINDIIYPLSEKIPINFYKELLAGKSKFTIDSFFCLKNTFIEKIKREHKLKLGEEVEKLEKLEVDEKIAPLVLEIRKTPNFIVLQLKYKIKEELFNIEDYKYSETINWLDKDNKIKISRENKKLVQYLSDENLSEDIFSQLFKDTRIRYTKNPKSPFLCMISIINVEQVINEVIPKAEKLFEIDYKDGKPSFSRKKIEFEIEADLNSKINLFEFKIKFKVGDTYFDLNFLKNLLQGGKKYLQLNDGTTTDIENLREITKWIEFLRRFNFKVSEKKYRSESKAALELEEFIKGFEKSKITSNEEYRHLILEMKEKKPVGKIPMPEEVEKTLRKYQKEGVYWLHFLKKYGFGGILADEMGLGKTIQALTILKMNKEGNHMVICPKTLIFNWENEAKKYFPNLKVLVIDGDIEKRKKLISEAKKYDVIITSYSLIQKDYEHYVFHRVFFNYLILDEAHYVKNMKTLSARTVRLINAKRKILLTGTPLENNLNELYGTFDLIMPGYLGTKTEFTKDFASKIERNNKIALEILQAKIRPFILRRTKKEVLTELPEKQEQIVYSEMTNKQVAIYREVLSRVRGEVNDLVKKQGFDKSRLQVLSALLKLRQICNHPILVDKSFEGEIELSGKYEQFLELLTEVIEGGTKSLVFSQFTSMLDIIEKELKEKKIKYLRLDGSTKNRQELIDKFNEDEEIEVFLISLKAGGVGINLTSASAVFLYDPWWNPMVEQQAIDRVHRIGQTKNVNIYKFITKNSIEEKILKLQERKGNLFENLLVEEQGFFKRLEWEDLMELFD